MNKKKEDKFIIVLKSLIDKDTPLNNVLISGINIFFLVLIQVGLLAIDDIAQTGFENFVVVSLVGIMLLIVVSLLKELDFYALLLNGLLIINTAILLYTENISYNYFSEIGTLIGITIIVHILLSLFMPEGKLKKELFTK